MTILKEPHRKLPKWLKRRIPASDTLRQVSRLLDTLGLHTVCRDANCPNIGHCWAKGTATIMILGNVCTRNCRFCSIPKFLREESGRPGKPDSKEPARIAEFTRKMGLKYIVITSVTRDDLPDGGAKHFRDCIRKVHVESPHTVVEILTPDFRGAQAEAIEILREARPFVFSHNVETVPALYPSLRPVADYQRSLRLLALAGEKLERHRTKSSIMLGLGEKDEQIEQVLKDLRNAGCEGVTIGQYLKPSPGSVEVVEYIRPEKFAHWAAKAEQMGFTEVRSFPFARSSYYPE